MIDYDRLKYAHELAKKLPYEAYSFDCWCNKGFDSNFFYSLSFQDEKDISHEYESENIEGLIIILENIVCPKECEQLEVDESLEILAIKTDIKTLMIRIGNLEAMTNSLARSR